MDKENQYQYEIKVWRKGQLPYIVQFDEQELERRISKIPVLFSMGYGLEKSKAVLLGEKE